MSSVETLSFALRKVIRILRPANLKRRPGDSSTCLSRKQKAAQRRATKLPTAYLMGLIATTPTTPPTGQSGLQISFFAV